MMVMTTKHFDQSEAALAFRLSCQDVDADRYGARQ